MKPRQGRWRLIAAILCVAGLLWLGFVATQIVRAGQIREVPNADVAIVLGAAVYGDHPSPVFEERIKHGIFLYRTGKAERLLFTGGRGEGAAQPESLVAARYAVAHGIPPHAISAETLSRTTRENLVQGRRVMIANDMRTALIVSDPLHETRALRMASDLGIRAYAAPTPTTRYRSWQTQAGFLLREVYFYHHYLLTGQ